MFCKKGVLKNFAKFTGNFLYQSLFFNKVPGCSFSLDQVFPVNFAKFVGTPFFIEHLLLLNIRFCKAPSMAVSIHSLSSIN